MTGHEHLFHPDGCVRGNIAVQPYTVTLAASCEHKKVRGADVTVLAESAAAARRYVTEWLPSLRSMAVTRVVRAAETRTP